MTGRFITLEGGEGSGKSTQVRRLAELLRASGLDVLETREPGGTPVAERIRALLLDGTAPRSALAEALLFNAARADHLERVVRPALAAGRWVVCDRFADSTRAYQGAAGGVDDSALAAIEQMVVAGTRPDLTLILDLDVATGIKRARLRQGAAPLEAPVPQTADAFEARELAFHERLREGYLAIARMEPRRCAVVDASGSPADVARGIAEIVAARLKLALSPPR